MDLKDTQVKHKACTCIICIYIFQLFLYIDMIVSSKEVFT
jgi:hypothetical protein